MNRRIVLPCLLVVLSALLPSCASPAATDADPGSDWPGLKSPVVGAARCTDTNPHVLSCVTLRLADGQSDRFLIVVVPEMLTEAAIRNGYADLALTAQGFDYICSPNIHREPCTALWRVAMTILTSDESEDVSWVVDEFNSRLGPPSGTQS